MRDNHCRESWLDIREGLAIKLPSLLTKYDVYR